MGPLFEAAVAPAVAFTFSPLTAGVATSSEAVSSVTVQTFVSTLGAGTALSRLPKAGGAGAAERGSCRDPKRDSSM